MTCPKTVTGPRSRCGPGRHAQTPVLVTQVGLEEEGLEYRAPKYLCFDQKLWVVSAIHCDMYRLYCPIPSEVRGRFHAQFYHYVRKD